MNIYYYLDDKLIKNNKVLYLESKSDFAYYMQTDIGAYSTDMLNHTVNSWTYFFIWVEWKPEKEIDKLYL